MVVRAIGGDQQDVLVILVGINASVTFFLLISGFDGDGALDQIYVVLTIIAIILVFMIFTTFTTCIEISTWDIPF